MPVDMNSLLIKTTNEFNKPSMSKEEKSRSMAVSARTTGMSLTGAKLPSIDITRGGARSLTSTATPVPRGKHMSLDKLSVSGHQSLIKSAFKMACLA